MNAKAPDAKEGIFFSSLCASAVINSLCAIREKRIEPHRRTEKRRKFSIFFVLLSVDFLFFLYAFHAAIS
uniref:Uncharacterized protein n=1 Tax=Candidatus Kentrum sp. FM TaxID=2126340 RepID=A0A450SLD8_9GAMM|nr:MAG: hypothetical protein BECKFM1743C_GA0114222_101396 [Candidatus Kentron sp. FM]VFJ67331.1 MAG: hypothetical protein BECKFM1743A_GA0114220_104443 [Candidatus Kentron sp. FM]VFK21258.1 MAG: hypothetical protein BECKFM1743B_GA0114221_107712 [Candidatus Kentron sp. FM]